MTSSLLVTARVQGTQAVERVKAKGKQVGRQAGNQSGVRGRVVAKKVRLRLFTTNHHQLGSL